MDIRWRYSIVEAISLKLPEELLKESNRYARKLGISRAAYLREAIERMNREARGRIRAERLKRESLLTRAESMRVNREFEAIRRDPDA